MIVCPAFNLLINFGVNLVKQLANELVFGEATTEHKVHTGHLPLATQRLSVQQSHYFENLKIRPLGSFYLFFFRADWFT